MTGQRLAAALVAAGLVLTGCSSVGSRTKPVPETYSGTWGDKDTLTCTAMTDGSRTYRCMAVAVDWTYTGLYGKPSDMHIASPLHRALREMESWETPADVRAHIAANIRSGYSDPNTMGVAVTTDGVLWTATKAGGR